MRIIALEVDKSEATADEFKPLLADEARKVWELYQEQIIREMYFRAERKAAVLILECQGIEDAKRRLSELPLVAAGLIDFDLIPLVPYPGLTRLFAD